MGVLVYQNIDGVHNIITEFGTLDDFTAFASRYNGSPRTERSGILDRFSTDGNETCITERRVWNIGLSCYMREHRWVAITDKGTVIRPETIVGLVREYSYRKWKSRYGNQPKWFSGHKRTNGSSYRKFKTFQERKMSVARIVEDGEPPIRCGRNIHSLPNTWDDIPRSKSHRSWKSYRKHQWKSK